MVFHSIANVFPRIVTLSIGNVRKSTSMHASVKRYSSEWQYVTGFEKSHLRRTIINL